MRIISLACKNCSAPLQIKEETDQLVCARCGAHMCVDRGGGAVSLELVEAIHTGTAQTAAELALVRLNQEWINASCRVSGLEHEAESQTQARDAFKKQVLLSSSEAESTSDRIDQLSKEVDRSNIGPVAVITGIVLALIVVVRAFSESGFWTVLGMLLLWGIGGVVLFVVVVGITAFFDSLRTDSAQKDLDAAKSRLASHRTALELQGRFAGAAQTAEQLSRARAQLTRIEEDISRNREIVSMR